MQWGGVGWGGVGTAAYSGPHQFSLLLTLARNPGNAELVTVCECLHVRVYVRDGACACACAWT